MESRRSPTSVRSSSKRSEYTSSVIAADAMAELPLHRLDVSAAPHHQARRRVPQVVHRHPRHARRSHALVNHPDPVLGESTCMTYPDSLDGSRKRISPGSLPSTSSIGRSSDGNTTVRSSPGLRSADHYPPPHLRRGLAHVHPAPLHVHVADEQSGRLAPPEPRQSEREDERFVPSAFARQGEGAAAR